MQTPAEGSKPGTCHVPPCHLIATRVLQVTFLDNGVDQAFFVSTYLPCFMVNSLYLPTKLGHPLGNCLLNFLQAPQFARGANEH